MSRKQTVEDPETTITDPELASADPETTIPDPELAAVDPEATIPDPELAAVDPEANITGPGAGHKCNRCIRQGITGFEFNRADRLFLCNFVQNFSRCPSSLPS